MLAGDMLVRVVLPLIGTPRLPDGSHRTARGPGAFFRGHRSAYALALAGALATAGYAAARGLRARPERALRWWALAGLTLAQAVGIAAARRRARLPGRGDAA